jgi:hypothetical protein
VSFIRDLIDGWPVSFISDLIDGWAARRSAEAQVARAVESVAARAAADLADEDVGWRKLSEGNDSHTPSELREIRGRCRKLYSIDPTVAQAVALLQSGALRSGELAPTCADARVEKVVEAFWADEDNGLALTSRDGLQLLHLSLMLEGERFLTLFTAPNDPAVVLADVAADEISQVIMHPENRRRPVAYKRDFRERAFDARKGVYESATGQQQTEYLLDWRLAPEVAGDKWDEDAALQELLTSLAPKTRPDCYVYHARLAGLGDRGVPAVWRAYEWAKAHGQSLSAMMTLTAAQAMFAWEAKVKSNDAATLAQFAASLEGTSRAQGPGAAFVGNEGVNLSPISVGTGGQQIQEATARQMHLQEIRAFGFGEHWYADSATGNLATATAMELPAVWRIEDHQALIRQTLERVCGFAVAVAQARGALPSDVDTTVTINMPDAQPASPAESAQLLQALSRAAQSGLIDPREASLQAYQALGTQGINAVMERQYPPEEKDAGQAPTVAGQTMEPTATLEPTPTPESARAAEAVGGRPFGDGLRPPR